MGGIRPGAIHAGLAEPGRYLNHPRPGARPVRYAVRMSDAQASAAARELARARWGTRVLDAAVETVLTRSADLDDAQRAELAAAIGQEAPGGDG
jgi:hypothetical protein